MSLLLLSRPVLFDAATGDVELVNPVPERAKEQRKTPTVNKAVGLSGIGRVDWEQVEAHVADWHARKANSDLAAFIRHFRLSAEQDAEGKPLPRTDSQLRDCFLAENAKTRKPREATGRPGQILGLALFPHYYPNYLNVVPEEFVDSHGVVDVPQYPEEDPRFRAASEKGARLREFFNSFDGTKPASIQPQTGVPATAQLNFCTGSSPACRSICLVLTGNNPASTPAVAKKANLTQALLTNPDLFVAGLYAALDALSRTRAKTMDNQAKVKSTIARIDELVSIMAQPSFQQLGKKDKERKKIESEHSRLVTSISDTVVRLNMLSDLPWYAICPELLEQLADPARGNARVYWYDYSKVAFWKSPEYQNLGRSIGLAPGQVLDLTFSFSGTDNNTEMCREALDVRDPELGYPNGIRVALAFASADPSRRATVAQRTSWGEILSAGQRDGSVRATRDGYKIALATLGERVLVDGDDNDYRIDDPGGCIVALNFKEPAISEQTIPGFSQRVAEAREAFTQKVPSYGLVAAMDEGARAAPKPRRKRANPLEVLPSDAPLATGDAPEAMASGELRYPMFQVGRLLIGPHVPTVLED